MFVFYPEFLPSKITPEFLPRVFTLGFTVVLPLGFTLQLPWCFTLFFYLTHFRDGLPSPPVGIRLERCRLHNL